ncbi:CpxP family protein [Photobacterium damselae]|uniref:CpxP family protein n=1 Tax=Photobacterium damselae subsp. damselae TaxID=85581 RepID=A0A7Y7QDC7_PHODD|nr:CpxP family protein [Photobacterium damselae]AWK80780.1 stress adaptor protein CpxP [Photobacterium damselae]MCG3816521.1 CpxP family protein [Photobacterium damselae]NVH52268.1 CpxP family protein [Photobacterium damselae subsp. damselae]NVO62497.1 CpxP family protein [Photobacterium damselae subsp. damselae]NVO81460.1 CpxP family protein [Photobacterium damselae subsp. damselae]
MAKLNKVLVMAIALPMVVGSASAMAFGGKHHGDHGSDKCGMHGGKKIFSQLNLTDAQQEKMKELRQENRAEMKSHRGEHRQEMKAYHDQMQDLVLSSSFDEGQARALAEKMSQQQVERRVQMLENRQKMLNILTPEQKEKYKELRQQNLKQCAERWNKDAK